ncbi:cytochrome P450 [Streptomyces durbertensis]|uniref:Cytochrome P450 n=1 Tax=Streptomyces durbertensis TaxID=2448886 RepID=A0ABR6EFL9_9ACTN|nr:cytochrome P450 [Streptomyces durbertensis]
MPAFPWRRACPYAPPEQYDRLVSERRPVVRVELAVGGWAWLVTGYEEVRQVLSDQRFSIDRAHPGFPYIIPTPKEFRTNASLLGMDGERHSSYRRLVAAEFTTRRIRAMREEVQRVVDGCIDRMLAEGSPADLVPALSLPVPTAVITELLGVPSEEHEFFHAQTRLMLNGGSSAEDRMRGLRNLEEFLGRQIDRKEKEPGEDLLSRVVVRARQAGLTDRGELVSLARLLMVAGHETSANMISLGTLTLLRHPDQLEMLKQDPSLVPGAVEELLRVLSLADLSSNRVAATDVEIGGVLIREGEGVIAAGLSANHDPRAFPDPTKLDIRRAGPRNVAFGYGPHLCVGADLTRLELEVVFGTLFRRIPDLRLVKPMEELAYKDRTIIYGVHEMPVAW